MRSAKTSEEAWDTLEKHFQRNTLSRKILYRRKLYSACMNKGANMVEHINHIKMLAEHLEAIDDNMAEKDLVRLGLETIDEEKLIWDYVRDRLIHEAEKMAGGLLDSKNPDAAHDALVVKTEQRKSSTTKYFKCHYCRRKGHHARHCYKRKADAKNSEPENRAVGNFVAD